MQRLGSKSCRLPEVPGACVCDGVAGHGQFARRCVLRCIASCFIHLSQTFTDGVHVLLSSACPGQHSLHRRHNNMSTTVPAPLQRCLPGHCTPLLLLARLQMGAGGSTAQHTAACCPQNPQTGRQQQLHCTRHLPADCRVQSACTALHQKYGALYTYSGPKQCASQMSVLLQIIIGAHMFREAASAKLLSDA